MLAFINGKITAPWKGWRCSCLIKGSYSGMQIFVYLLKFSERKANIFYPYSYRLADVLRIATKNSCIGDLYSFNRAWRNFRNVEDEKKKEESIQRKPVLNRNWNTQSALIWLSVHFRRVYLAGEIRLEPFPESLLYGLISIFRGTSPSR